MTINTDVLIVGGGIAGLSAAYHLEKMNCRDYIVAEKNSFMGGLCASVKKDGFTFDYSGHLLHLHSDYGKRLAFELLAGNLLELRRDTRIFSKGVYTKFPFQANTYGLPEEVVRECVDGYLKAYAENKTVPPDSPFEDWALSIFGPGICKHFMWPYNRKLWQVPLSELTADWCAPFVPRPKPEDVIAGSKPGSDKAFGYNASFYYPRKGGCQAICDALGKSVTNLKLSCELLELDLENRKAVFSRLGEVRFNKLINTMPLKKFVALLKNAETPVKEAGRKLKITSVYNLNLGVRRCSDGKHWVYFPEKEFPFYRAGLASNFSPEVAPPGASSFYIEVSRPQGEPLDMEQTQKEIIPALEKAGLMSAGDEVLSALWLPLPDAYVVYNADREPALKTITAYLEKRDCSSIGRYGAWKYSFMEEALLEGRASAEKFGGKL